MQTTLALIIGVVALVGGVASLFKKVFGRKE